MTAMQFFFPFNYSNTSDNRACKPVSDFISDKLKGFFPSPLNDNFVTIFCELILFFFYKNANISYLVTHSNPPILKGNSCMRGMPNEMSVVALLSSSLIMTSK